MDQKRIRTSSSERKQRTRGYILVNKSTRATYRALNSRHLIALVNKDSGVNMTHWQSENLLRNKGPFRTQYSVIPSLPATFQITKVNVAAPNPVSSWTNVKNIAIAKTIINSQSFSCKVTAKDLQTMFTSTATPCISLNDEFIVSIEDFHPIITNFIVETWCIYIKKMPSSLVGKLSTWCAQK